MAAPKFVQHVYSWPSFTCQYYPIQCIYSQVLKFAPSMESHLSRPWLADYTCIKSSYIPYIGKILRYKIFVDGMNKFLYLCN